MPTVSVHKQFRVLVEDDLATLFPTGRRVVAHPGTGRSDAGLATIDSTERVLLAVGPEGGWNAFELKLLAAHGFHPYEMGGRTLRTDTACIALVALIHDAIRRTSHKEGTHSRVRRWACKVSAVSHSQLPSSCQRLVLIADVRRSFKSTVLTSVMTFA